MSYTGAMQNIQITVYPIHCPIVQGITLHCVDTDPQVMVDHRRNSVKATSSPTVCDQHAEHVHN